MISPDFYLVIIGQVQLYRRPVRNAVDINYIGIDYTIEPEGAVSFVESS